MVSPVEGYKNRGAATPKGFATAPFYFIGMEMDWLFVEDSSSIDSIYRRINESVCVLQRDRPSA